MEEGTIFNPQAAPQNVPQNSPPPPPPASIPQPVAPPPIPPAQPGGVTSSVPPPPPLSPDRKSSFSGKIIKLILGVFALFIVLISALLIVSKLVHRAQPVNSGPVALTYWGMVDESKVDGAIKGFESENPQIKVTYVKEDSGDYVEKLKVRIPNGNGPDVYMYKNSWLPILSSYLLPLPQSVTDQKEISDKYYAVISSDLVKNGAAYGIPLDMDTLSLFINPSLLPADRVNNNPATWQEFVDLAQSSTKRDDQGKITVAGAGIGTFDNVNHAQDIFGLLFAQNGVNYNKISDYQDRISQALTFYTDFAQVENSVWDDAQDSSLTAFSEGKLAMYLGYGDDINSIKSQSSDLSFRIAPIPQLSGENPKNIASYMAQGISSRTQYQKEAFLFMKYISDHNLSVGSVPADKRSNNTDANLEVIQSQAGSAVSSPFAADTTEKSLSAKIIGVLRTSVNSVLGGGSADEAAAHIITGYSNTVSSLQNSSSGK